MVTGEQEPKGDSVMGNVREEDSAIQSKCAFALIQSLSGNQLAQQMQS